MNARWWKIRTDESRETILSVEPAAAAGEDDRTLLFVQAFDKAHARRFAENTLSAERMRAKRAEWSAAGKCTKCGRERDRPDHRRCSLCRAAKSAENTRAYRRKKGETVPTPTRQEGAARNRDLLQTSTRLQTLRDVLGWFHALPNRRDFAAKLQEMIKAAGGEDAAA